MPSSRTSRANSGRSTSGPLSARIVAAVPLVVLVAIRQLNPAYLAVFDTPFGQMVLAACFVSVALGYAAMRWTARLPGDPRVLRAGDEGVRP